MKAAFRPLVRRLLKLEIVLCLAWARFLIRFVPFRWWRDTLGTLGYGGKVQDPQQLVPAQVRKAADIGIIIRRVASRMPFNAVCLPQAMTGRWILARRGISSQIEIGSREGDAGEEKYLFHAWLVAGNNVVTGQDEADRFHSLGKAQPAAE